MVLELRLYWCWIQHYCFGYLARQYSLLRIYFSQQLKILSPIWSGLISPQPHTGECRTATCHLLFPILSIPHLTHWIPLHKQKILCLPLWQEITFLSAVPAGKDLCKFLFQSPSHHWNLCYSFQSSEFKLNSLLTFWPVEKMLECHALSSSCLPVDLKIMAHSQHQACLWLPWGSNQSLLFKKIII